MNFIYIPVANFDLGLELGRRLLDLSFPPELRPEWYGSLYFCGPVAHPTLPIYYMELSTEPLWIYPEADETLLNSILEPFIQQGLITQADVVLMQQHIINSRGTFVNVTEFIPTFWLSVQKTREGLEGMGFFPEPLLD
jgi:hypothetical protein